MNQILADHKRQLSIDSANKLVLRISEHLKESQDFEETLVGVLRQLAELPPEASISLCAVALMILAEEKLKEGGFSA